MAHLKAAPPTVPHYPIRSYVLRRGRTTPAQQRALQSHWAEFGLEVGDRSLDLHALFARDAATVLEIGFGNGEVLATLAEANPNTNFIGIEVYPSGIGALLGKMKSKALTNLRLIRGDAAIILPRCFADHSLSKILILFPDPWPKKRHHKRRLIQADFVSTLADKLSPAGLLHLATDCEDYAQAMHTTLAKSGRYQRLDTATPPRPVTAFERRGHALGHRTYEMQYQVRPPSYSSTEYN